MSRAVLISIWPKWCELIASGEKTIEVRKTRPKEETPFKSYICTNPKFEHEDFFVIDAGTEKARAFYGGGKVIGEFVCDEVSRYAKYGYRFGQTRYMKSSPGGYPATEIHFHSLQLSPDDLEQYGKGATLYGWHISDLKIYDEPKKLSEFKRHDPTYDFSIFGEVSRTYSINRPPQSWCYVEELV